ncbi:MAG: L-seryl-tRNA(Sec) selenium transferase [Spirochaetaceae bacterium]|jgi:L-seryl-tRNA(Ser) seleniumtransferase|nr:L-seryl-tRNA(Sec) selenium transferase [Spirochaetaceae bacterium]
MPDKNALPRSIPAMDELLNTAWAAEFSGCLGRETVKKIINETLSSIRKEILNGTDIKESPKELVEKRAKTLLTERITGTFIPVINATGVVIHTNFGRAPLAAEALSAVNNISGSYSSLEYSLEKGVRAERGYHVEWSVRHLTGAEAALVVNNNAAAVLLALSAMAAGREVIVSRGELVEIGGSFRIPEILSFSGAQMTAVGCTNSTRISDYRGAVTENTAVLLKVHPSNYRIEGFVKTTSREELAELAASQNLIFMEDLGSGLLCELETRFTNHEHTVRDCLKAGSDIVTFSGDKLLGGPQIGVIAGSKSLIDKMKNHQLMRALRVDKMTLAAFEATLRLYLSGKRQRIPVIRMIEISRPELLKKARALLRLLKQTAAANSQADNFSISVVETRDTTGGGSYPTDTLPGFGVEIKPVNGCEEALALSLRRTRVPVISSMRGGGVILHVRTLLPGDEKQTAASFAEAISVLRPRNNFD